MDNKPLIDQITVLKSIHNKLRGATLNHNNGYQLPGPDLYMLLLHVEVRVRACH